MTDQVFRASFDTFVSQDHTGGNYGDYPRLRMSNQASHNKFSYVHFPMQIPSDATVVDATLSVYLNGAWAGANTMTVKRITQHWGERTLDWSSRPNVTTTHSAAASVTGGTDREVLEANVTSLVQDWVQGSANYGWRLEVAGSANRDLFSSEYADTSVRPQLTVSWVLPPDAPHNLRPGGERAVSSGTPLLLWESDEPAFAYVQVDTTEDFSSGSLLLDTGFIAVTEAELSSASLTNNTTYWWRVKIQDANGVASDWSDASEFEYRTLGVAAITVPAGATVTTTRPVITHTLTGRTQAFSAYLVYEDDVLVYERPKLATTATSFTLPLGYIRDTTASYDLVVRVWDTFDREVVGTALDYAEDVQTVTLVDSVGTGPVLTLTATQDDGHVVLTWTRAAAPDSFSIRVDGVIVEDEIEPADVLVSGTTYRKSFYRAAPWASSTSTYSVLAVTSAIQSAANPTATLTFQPRGIWLVDEDSGYEVNILGRDPVSSVVGESGATFFPLGRRDPVRIVDSIRGFEGGISGALLTWSGTTIAEAKTAFQYLKGHPDAAVRLIYGRRNIPVTLGDATLELIDQGEEAYSVDVSYFQRDEWTITLEG